MINFDLSKALHPRLWDLLPAFMPGLFFEICVFLSEPDWFFRIVGHARLERYMEITIALILAFIVGNGFMFWVVMLRIESEGLYKRARFLWAKFVKYLSRSRGIPLKRPWLGRFKWVDRAFQKLISHPNTKGTSQAWRLAASKLLERRYGIDPQEIHIDEWQPWVPALGTPKPDDFRGSLLVVTSHATGWSGMAAAYFASSLRNRYFIPFCGFLIVYGFLHNFSVIARWNNAGWLIALKAVLAEIPMVPSDKGENKNVKLPDI
jgi:hypothetical protein